MVDDGAVEIPQPVVKEAAQTPPAKEQPKAVARVSADVAKAVNDGLAKQAEVPDSEAARETLETVAGKETMEGAAEKDEKAYISQNQDEMAGLEDRYNDERTEAVYLQKQIAEFASKSGLQHEEPPQLKDKSFTQETEKIVLKHVLTHIDRLFNSERGRINPEKQKLVAGETKRYLELMLQAQEEGDLSTNLDSQTVLKLVEENVWALAYQDRVASENLLGDHGIRHLVGHNITTCENISDELVKQGQSVKAIDRLIFHQAMILHDLGYAMDPIRDAINKGGFGADKGHNVLSAKYLRTRLALPNDVMKTVFSDDQLAIIHKGILYHDSSEVKIHVGDNSQEARKENIFSAIHVADNTHAFEDKLPELLYSHPDTLRVMRLMKTAGEIGDGETFARLQKELVGGIESSSNLSLDDKEALTKAAQSLKSESYRFSVGRICGNKPRVSINKEGRLTISVQESAIHQEVVGLFGQKPYDQLRKFVADLTGQSKKEVDLSQRDIVSKDGQLEIILRIGENNQREKTDYDQRVEQLIKDKQFQEFVIGNGKENLGDGKLSAMQSVLQERLKTVSPKSKDYQKITGRITAVKEQRKKNLLQYLGKS